MLPPDGRPLSSEGRWQWRAPDCTGHDYFVAFSCKLRCICPSCHMKRELIWAEWAANELLEDVPHRQVVFTIPKRLRPYFRYERALLGDLAGCAWRALRLWVLAYFEDEAAVPGAVGFIRTILPPSSRTRTPTPSPVPVLRSTYTRDTGRSLHMR